MAEEKPFDIFMSHDWGVKSQNHERVAKINEQLKKRNFRTWMDTDGGIVDQLNDDMARGIEESAVGCVFITGQYRDKVNGYTDRGANDNCYREFGYMIQQITSTKMIAVVLDPELRNPTNWKGTLGLNMAGKLYLDMSGNLNDERYMERQVNELASRVEKLLNPNPRPVQQRAAINPRPAPTNSAPINVDKEGNTALHHAVNKNDVNEVKRLIAESPSLIETKNNKEITPLNLAAGNGALNLLKLLVTAGGDVNTQNDSDTTPLFWATYKNHVRIVEYLLQNGADPNIPNRDRWTPLDMAHAPGHCECGVLIRNAGGTTNVNELCKCANCKKSSSQREYVDDDGNTSLHRAVLDNDVKELKQILAQNPSLIDEANYKEITPLNLAAGHGRLPMVKLLVTAGADVNAQNDTDTTPLFWATFSNHVRVVDYLLQHGADANIPNRDHWTPLDMANGAGHSECAVRIKKAGGTSNVHHECKK